MEDNLNAVTVGISQNILVKLQGFLLVATKEIHLDALHANLLQPLKLAVTCQRGIQTVTWALRGIVPVAV